MSLATDELPVTGRFPPQTRRWLFCSACACSTWWGATPGLHFGLVQFPLIQHPWWLSSKEFACQFRRYTFDHWVRKIPWSRKWQFAPVFLPEKSHGQRSLAVFCPWDQKSQTQLNPQEHMLSSASLMSLSLSLGSFFFYLEAGLLQGLQV